MCHLNMGYGWNSKHVVEQEKVRRTTFYMVKGITGVSVTREKMYLSLLSPGHKLLVNLSLFDSLFSKYVSIQ